MDILTFALNKRYTDESIQGITGTLAGKNCKVKSIEKIGNSNIVTFEWTADDGITETTTMTVKDGVQRVRLITDGSHIYDKDDNILTFTQIKDLVMDNGKFVTLTLDDNISFLPSAYDGSAIWFDAGYIESGIPNQLRVIINNQNQVNLDQIELATDADVNSLDARVVNIKSDVDSITTYSSSAETFIGTWIDNKSIYRKVYELTDPSVFPKGTGFKVADLPTDFGMLIKGSAILKTYENSYTNNDILVYSTSSAIMCKQNFSGYAEKMWIIVEYTKTI